jgi:putative N-acetylmannosamine-6-phosphate epimerase
MSIAEKETYDMLMTMSGINKQLPSHDGNDADHIKKLKERLVLIESEIMAGNNNINTLAELKKVLTRLHHFKVITGSQVTRHVAEIKKNYF